MSDQIPPPGPERDAEILLRLGKTRPAFTDPPVVTIERDGDGTCSVSGVPPYWTDPAACDRLVEEMVRRGWNCQVTAQFDRRTAVFQGEAFLDGDAVIGEPARGATIADAVSAAALLALRSQR